MGYKCGKTNDILIRAVLSEKKFMFRLLVSYMDYVNSGQAVRLIQQYNIYNLE